MRKALTHGEALAAKLVFGRMKDTVFFCVPWITTQSIRQKRRLNERDRRLNEQNTNYLKRAKCFAPINGNN